MKRSSQTEKKVFSSANGFEKRPAAKKNCADYGFCAAQIFIALTTAVSLLFGKKLGWNLRENMLICIMTSVLLFSPWACRACSQGFIPADSETAVYAVDNGRTDFRQDI